MEDIKEQSHGIESGGDLAPIVNDQLTGEKEKEQQNELKEAMSEEQKTSSH